MDPFPAALLLTLLLAGFTAGTILLARRLFPRRSLGPSEIGTFGFRAGWIVLSLLGVAGGVWLTLREVERLRLLGESVPATATIVDRRVDYFEEMDHHWLQYEYEAPGPLGQPQTFRQWERVSSSTYHDHPPSSTVEIRFATGDPSITALADRSDYFALEPGLLVAAISLIFLAIGLAWNLPAVNK